MNLIDKIFNNPKVECPRCLGKGNVDWEDIKRLEKELKWLPGKCAYCNGSGKVRSEMLSKLSADTTYLTTDISEEERKNLTNNDFHALNRATHYDQEVNGFIKQIEYLYFIGNLDINKIVEFYLISRPEHEITAQEKQELKDYIEKVIEHKKTGKN